MSRGRGQRGGANTIAVPRAAAAPIIDPAYLDEAARTIEASEATALASIRDRLGARRGEDEGRSLEQLISRTVTDVALSKADPESALSAVHNVMQKSLSRMRPHMRPLGHLARLADTAFLQTTVGSNARANCAEAYEAIRRIFGDPSVLDDPRTTEVVPMFNYAPPREIQNLEMEILADLLRGDTGAARARIAAFWEAWGDSDRARACLNAPESSIDLLCRLSRARSILGRENDGSLGTGSFHPLLLLPDISQDDLDPLALNRLEGDRYERARAASPAHRRPFKELGVGGYAAWQAGVRSILRAPGNWKSDPKDTEGVLKVSVPVSIEGLTEVARRFDERGGDLRGQVRVSRYHPEKGAAAARGIRVTYQLLASHEGEPVIVEAVCDTGKTTTAKTADGLARVIGPHLAAAGIKKHEDQIQLIESADDESREKFAVARQIDEFDRLNPEYLEDLQIKDGCTHARGSWKPLEGTDRAGLRLECPSCGRLQARVLPAHRISPEARSLPVGSGAGVLAGQGDLRRYLEREKAYALLLGEAVPEGEMTLEKLIERDGQVDDLGFDLSRPAASSAPRSVAAAMSRR